MNIHNNAKLTPQGRQVLCARVIDQGWSVMDTAAAASISIKTARKWVSRYKTGVWMVFVTGLLARNVPRHAHQMNG